MGKVAYLKNWNIVRPEASPKVTSKRISTGEQLGVLANISKPVSLEKLTIHQEILPAGRRSSPPHYHSSKEEIVYVVNGSPSVWIDGKEKLLSSGEFVGFSPGEHRFHMITNNTEIEALLIVISYDACDDVVTYFPEQLELFSDY